jgi:hypothetical protein
LRIAGIADGTGGELPGVVRRMTAHKSIRHVFEQRGHYWRVQSGDDGTFDEVVVRLGRKSIPAKKVVRGKVVRNPKADSRSGLILHAEMMDARSCFIDVAGLAFWVHVERDGVARITYAEDRRAKANRGDVQLAVER